MEVNEQIPISRKVLMQYNFVRMDDTYFYRNVDEETKFWCLIDEEGYHFALDHEEFKTCRWLHELQNFFFEVTDTDL